MEILFRLKPTQTSSLPCVKRKAPIEGAFQMCAYSRFACLAEK